MAVLWVIASNTFRQTVRQRLFYNIAVFGVGMLLLSMVLGQITFGFPDRVVRSIGLSGVSISLDLIALLIAVTLIHQEIDRKTLFVVLTRPVHRWQFVVGRYLGLLITLAITLAGLSAVFFMTLRAANGKPLSGDVVALAALLPEASILAGVGLVLSSFSSPMLSAGMGLAIWISSTATDDLVRLTEKADLIAQVTAKVAYYLLPALARFNFREAAVYQVPVSMVELASSVAYGALYSLALMGIASAILNRREMV